MTFPASTSASGIWTLRDALRYKAAGQWPRGPVAPTSLAGTPGDEQVALTWTAPATTHGTITDYIVEYTPAAGSPTVVATGSTAVPYTLTGLTNDTEYTFRVAAVNHTRGDWSSSVAVTPSGAPADPDFASVALLLHFDGDITDSSGYAQTMTAPWGASFDAVNYKFGTHSLSGNGSHVTRDSFPAGNPLLIGSNPFTIEFWLYFAGYLPSPSTLVWSNNANFKFELANYGSYRNLMAYFGGFWLEYNADQTVPLNQWSHLAAVGYGSGGGVALYVNGTRVAFSANTYNFGSDPIGPIGLQNNHNASNRFDEFRFTNGVARYSTETIAVPTEPFPDY
jgi:hypothetical protein